MQNETLYSLDTFKLTEKKHLYGSNIHLIDDPYSLTLLAQASTSRCELPILTHLIKRLYQRLIGHVINDCLPKEIKEIPTRMLDYHAEAVFNGFVFNTDTKAVTVDLARAGMIPSQVIFEELTYFLNPHKVRQDHFYAARAVNKKEEVTGVDISGSKIGGDINDCYVFFPDPMGATGNTISEAIRVYKEKVSGKVKKFLCLHLIITPEYIQRIQKDHPDAEVYALRLDRGLSSARALKSCPGEFLTEEKGLNSKQYIVPGAGGLGELLNNSFV